MSVLFRALNKAARDYQERQSPVFVPIAPIGRVQRGLRRKALLGISFVALVLAAGVFFAFDSGNEAVAATTPVNEVKTKEAGEKVVRPGRIRLEKSAPDGIALPIESLAVDGKGETDSVSRAVEEQVRDTPALKAGKAKSLSSAPRKKASIKVTKVAKAKPVKAAKKPMKLAQADTPEVEESALEGSSLPPIRKAHALLEEGNYVGALNVYNDILDKNAKDRAALEGKAYVLEQSGVAAALPELDRIASANPKIAPVQAALGRLLTRLGQKPRALEVWKKAVELDPANPIYRLSLGILYDRNGFETDALKLYREVPEPVPDEIKQRIEFLSTRAKDYP